MNVLAVEEYIIQQLSSGLSPDLHYHNLAHTMAVVSRSHAIAVEEGVVDSYALTILKTAALLHDTGFLVVYDNHEEEGCKIAQRILPSLEYSVQDIDMICGLIMKTKIPQAPVTHLEMILCDADLDHLGSQSFKEVSSRLLEEWKAFHKIKDEKEWNQIQYNFLKDHSYWTATSRAQRDPLKATYLEELRQELGLNEVNK